MFTPPFPAPVMTVLTKLSEPASSDHMVLAALNCSSQIKEETSVGSGLTSLIWRPKTFIACIFFFCSGMTWTEPLRSLPYPVLATV